MKPITAEFKWTPGPHVLLTDDYEGAVPLSQQLVHDTNLDQFAQGTDSLLLYLEYGHTWHYKRIEEDLRRFRETPQLTGIALLIVTMNSAVIDNICVESVDEVMQRFLVVRNGVIQTLDLEEATRFFNAYKVGIQYVSEILRTEGIW